MSDYEQTLALINEVHVFKVPPRTSSEGYKAEGWTQNHLWTGQCRVVGIGKKCEVRLENKNDGKIFAKCIVNTDDGGANAIEPVIDSSRYFVLRIEDLKNNRHAFIGIGFGERADAFDFNVALQDHEKYVQRLKEQSLMKKVNIPAKDYSVKEGEKIKLNFKVKNAKGKVRDISAKPNSSPGGSTSKGGLLLAPPPGASSTPKKNGSNTSNHSSGFSDDFSDFVSGSN